MIKQFPDFYDITFFDCPEIKIEQSESILTVQFPDFYDITFFDCPEIKIEQSESILTVPYEKVKITGDFARLTPHITYRKARINEIYEDLSTTKKEMSHEEYLVDY